MQERATSAEQCPRRRREVRGALAALLLCAGLLASISLSAETDPAAVEAQALIDRTWDDIRRLSEQGEFDESARIQRATAGQLFAFYVENPSTETGGNALASAFMMWGNVGDAGAVDAAMPRVDPDSEAWSGLLSSINNAYVKSGRTARGLRRLLVKLDRRLTDPKSRSALLMMLAEHDLYRGRRKKARRRLDQVIRLDADPFYVEGARGEIYELESLRVGQAAPDFTAHDTEGRRVSLAELRGKVVVLEFWSTTCGPCMPEIPHLREMFEELGESGVEIVGVSLDRKLSDLRLLVAREKIGWRQICDEMAYDGTLAKAYNVRGIPRSYVIDTQGRIASRHVD